MQSLITFRRRTLYGEEKIIAGRIALDVIMTLHPKRNRREQSIMKKTEILKML